MNDYQDALNRCKLDFEDRIKEDIVLMVGYMDLEKLQELVDKATPKEVLTPEWSLDNECPNCGNVEWIFQEYPNENSHCHICGQALIWDWRENETKKES